MASIEVAPPTTTLREPQPAHALIEEQTVPSAREALGRSAAQAHARLARGIVRAKAAALFCGAYLLRESHPAGAAVCLAGGIGLAGVLVTAWARRWR